MRKIIEWCYVSADGIFEDPIGMRIREYWDEAYLRDALGLFAACDAILFGRCTYEIFAKIWSGNHGHPYAARLDASSGPARAWRTSLRSSGGRPRISSSIL